MTKKYICPMCGEKKFEIYLKNNRYSGKCKSCNRSRRLNLQQLKYILNETKQEESRPAWKTLAEARSNYRIPTRKKTWKELVKITQEQERKAEEQQKERETLGGAPLK